MNADHLVRDLQLDFRLNFTEELPADIDRAELRKVDASVPTDDELICVILVAVQENVDRIPRADDVVRRYGDIAERLEARGVLGEDVVAEGLEGLLPCLLQGQERHANLQRLEGG